MARARLDKTVIKPGIEKLFLHCRKPIASVAPTTPHEHSLVILVRCEEVQADEVARFELILVVVAKEILAKASFISYHRTQQEELAGLSMDFHHDRQALGHNLYRNLIFVCHSRLLNHCLNPLH